MKTNNPGIALLAALILAHTGVFVPAAQADEAGTPAVEAAESGAGGPLESLKREHAERALAEAAANAARGVVAATKLDLDIRLLGRISMAREL